LKPKTEVVIGAEDLTLRLDELMTESIEAAPGNEKSYPSGYGATITLHLKKGAATRRMTLTRLSAGYESHAQEDWTGYRVRFEGIAGNDQVRIIVDTVR
jgi:hypothetical protein